MNWYASLRSCALCVACLALFVSVAQATETPAEASPQTTYTMRDCVDQALRSSPRIMAAEDAVQKAEAEIGMARAGFLPQLTAFGTRKMIKGFESEGTSDSDYDDQTTDSYGLQLSQTLFQGLTIFNGYQRAVLAHEYVLAEKEDALARLTTQVQTTFLERLRAVEELKIYEAHLQSLETNGQALEAMFAQNLVAYSDVLTTQAEIANAMQRVSETRNYISTKTIELKGLMHVPFENDVTFVGNVWDAAYTPDWTLDEIRSHALKHRPAIRLARLGVSLVQKDRDIALGAFSPRVSLNLSYQNLDVDYDEMGFSGFRKYDRDYSKAYGVGTLNVEWNLFQGGRDYYNTQRVKHEVSRLQNNLKDQETLAYTEIESANSSFLEAKSRSKHALTFLKSARENVAMVQARLEKSLSTIPEMVLARSKLQQAESNLVKAQIDCQQALANLYYAMGHRTSALVQ
ncbi:TolC family protein [Desulfovibrionales bacterium]